MLQLPTTTIDVGKTSTIMANVSPHEKCWRLVHDGKKVLAIFESSGETWAKWDMFCATTEEECLDEIARLKLEYVPDVYLQEKI